LLPLPLSTVDVIVRERRNQVSTSCRNAQVLNMYCITVRNVLVQVLVAYSRVHVVQIIQINAGQVTLFIRELAQLVLAIASVHCEMLSVVLVV
jgi:hypothetical protein